MLGKCSTWSLRDVNHCVDIVIIRWSLLPHSVQLTNLTEYRIEWHYFPNDSDIACTIYQYSLHNMSHHISLDCQLKSFSQQCSQGPKSQDKGWYIDHWPTFYLNPKYFWPWIFLDSKNVLAQKMFFYQSFFGIIYFVTHQSHHFCYPTFFLNPTNFSDPKYFWSQNVSGITFFRPTNFRTQKMCISPISLLIQHFI